MVAYRQYILHFHCMTHSCFVITLELYIPVLSHSYGFFSFFTLVLHKTKDINIIDKVLLTRFCKSNTLLFENGKLRTKGWNGINSIRLWNLHINNKCQLAFLCRRSEYFANETQRNLLFLTEHFFDGFESKHARRWNS